MKYQALDSVWRYEHPLRMYMEYWALESGTQFRMEIRMPTQNMHEILSTGFRH